MSLSLSKRLIRLLQPEEEARRMEMREVRCMAEANAIDLTRTISIHESAIVEAITKGKAASDSRQQRRDEDSERNGYENP